MFESIVDWLNTGLLAGGSPCGAKKEGAMGAGTQVRLLLWKNWTIRRRQRVITSHSSITQYIIPLRVAVKNTMCCHSLLMMIVRKYLQDSLKQLFSSSLLYYLSI